MEPRTTLKPAGRLPTEASRLQGFLHQLPPQTLKSITQSLEMKRGKKGAPGRHRDLAKEARLFSVIGWAEVPPCLCQFLSPFLPTRLCTLIIIQFYNCSKDYYRPEPPSPPPRFPHPCAGGFRKSIDRVSGLHC